MRVKAFVAVGLMAALAPLNAQEIGPQERASLVAAQLAEKIAVEGVQQRMAVEARFTSGAPYSAEAVNESVQVLADGNRISKKSVTRIYRDSEGRTRREQVGPDGHVQSISISDPVAGVSYVLNPQERTAFRNGVTVVRPDGYASATMTSGSFVARTGEGGAVAVVEGKQAAEVAARAGAGARGGGDRVLLTAPTAASPVAVGGGRGVLAPQGGMATTVALVGKTTTEELGQQIVEGVPATGKRTTTVIDAGAIGNDRPITTVSEQWTATDLKLLVATKHTDPRSGETVYRLTNIVQAEQPRSLFEIPADYTLKESTIRRSPALQN